MKIAPITNNNIQNKNISIKGSQLAGLNMICRAQMSLWRRPFPQNKEPFKFPFGDLIFNTDYLDKGDAKIFEGKVIQEVQQIRKSFKSKAEANVEKLEELVKNFFPSSSCLNIETSKDDSKLHVVLRKNWKETLHDFGPVNLSEKNNSFSDIESVKELVERIENLSQKEIAEINKKLKHKPIEPPPDKPIDVSGAVSIIIMA